LLPQRILDIPRHGWVNLHFSVLPAWRGAAPVQRAIIAGDQSTGATTFRIVLELDAGPIFASVTEPIRPDDTAGDLLHRLSLRGAQLLVDTVDGIEMARSPRPHSRNRCSGELRIQDHSGRCRNRLEPAGDVIDRLIRGCYPAPGAWTTFNGDRFKINSARLSGMVLSAGALEITKRSVHVGTGTRALELGEVQAQARSRWPLPTGRAALPSTPSRSSVPV
jgi:methionyl-tRNA formyltransferase